MSDVASAQNAYEDAKARAMRAEAAWIRGGKMPSARARWDADAAVAHDRQLAVFKAQNEYANLLRLGLVHDPYAQMPGNPNAYDYALAGWELACAKVDDHNRTGDARKVGFIGGGLSLVPWHREYPPKPMRPGEAGCFESGR